MSEHWTRDRTTGWLGVGFVVLLLASEGALTLPDEHASAASVADFYTAHEAVIIGLQVAGFVACALLAGFAWRHRVVDRRIAITGLVLSVLAAVPGAVTIVTALLADTDHPAPAGRYNRLEPRGDDLLFIGIVLFASAVVACRATSPTWLRVLAALVTVACLLRLVLELAGHTGGALQSVAPLAFIVLVAAMSVVAFTGYPRRVAHADVA